MKHFLLFGLFFFLTSLNAQDVNESFEQYTDNSYGTISTYNDPNGGMWETNNALAEGVDRSRTGSKAVRFNDDSGANEYLLYLGTDGNGKDGGLTMVSLWYRHWDMDGSPVSFLVEYNQAGAGWVQIGSTTSVSSITYMQFSETVNVTGDDILIRISSVEDDERLIIDDVVFASSVLPVYLSQFDGQPISEGNNLTWTTAQEQNNDYFQVQRSTDTQEWTTIGQVAGNGTTEVESNYEFLDREPATGVNYYRLQQFDYDGASEIHRTISVRNETATGPVSVFPNPVQEELTIRSHSAATVVVTDRLGRIVSSVRFDATETPFQMDTREWAIGTYFVSVRTVDGVNTTKIVKQ